MAKCPPEIAAILVTRTKKSGWCVVEAEFNGETYAVRGMPNAHDDAWFDVLERSLRTHLMRVAGSPVIRMGEDGKYGVYKSLSAGTSMPMSITDYEAERATWVTSP
jgi:hypothetical protein